MTAGVLPLLLATCGEDERRAQTQASSANPPPAATPPAEPGPSPSAATRDRTVLPIPAAPRRTYTELDVRDASPPPPDLGPQPPGDAPNVVIILIDDFGFGLSSTFGGPVPTPTMDALAAEGLRYNNFHTTALCSPTRAALRTGRNHHMTNVGSITETATGFPGDTSAVPNEIAGLPTILQLNGYSTAAFGKWHETPVWEASVSGPFFRWPLQQGFDHFYGFIGGETNQWVPSLFEGQSRIPVPDEPDYHFMTDMTDQAIAWVEAQQAMTPDKPFFIYFAPGAVHAPHHVPNEWIEKFAGQFDAGWDAVRAQTFARQKQLGVIPSATELPAKPEAIVDWGSLTERERRVFARQAEVFAGFAAMTDYEIGRLLAAIDELGERDNTLVIYVAGDNGTSAEGGMVGRFNEMTYFNGVEESLDEIAAKLDEWGGPTTYPHMAAGWAVAFDSPFAWTKQVASDFGGTRNPLIVRWPQRVTAVGELREQFHHVIDLAPTVLEAVGLPEPVEVNGVEQIPMQGVSMVYTFADADADDRHITQYFEILGNRAIYHDGWLARTVHRAPWEQTVRHPLAADEWQLFHVDEDFSLAHDRSADHPDKLAELRALFLREAIANHVLPLDDRMFERFDPVLVGRPSLMAGRTSLTMYPGMEGMLENTVPNIQNRSFTITVALTEVGERPRGVLITQGGRFGGWSLYIDDAGKPAFTYNFLGLELYTIVGQRPLPRGEVSLRFEFDYDGGLGGPGTATLRVDEREVATGRIERTQLAAFSADETLDVGVDLATAVVPSFRDEADSRLRGAELESLTLALTAQGIEP